jgi:CheY-like chemotaxis protein
MKILIAEDNLVNQLLMRMYMNKLGWEFSIVDNGFSAIEAYKKTEYNAILMDINMPEMDGIEASRYIRMMNQEIPIIALTAFGDNANRSNCANAGMNALLEKPVSLNSISEIVLELVSYNELKIA